MSLNLVCRLSGSPGPLPRLRGYFLGFVEWGRLFNTVLINSATDSLQYWVNQVEAKNCDHHNRPSIVPGLVGLGKSGFSCLCMFPVTRQLNKLEWHQN